MYPQGRAKENGLPWDRKGSHCFNIRAIIKQQTKPDLFGAQIMMAYKGYMCTPHIRVNGDIALGESDLCPPAASIYDEEGTIGQKIKDFHCHQCDFINESLPAEYRRFVD
jgi:hypothetical protein